MRIRHFAAPDAAACASLFYRAVHEGAAPHYSAEQRQAWAPNVPEADAFERKLSAQHCFVADLATGVLGFMSITVDGYLDMAYVAPEERRRGTARSLYAAVEGKARELRLRKMTTHASLLAQPFFTRQGWEIEAPEEIERLGVLIPRFRMFKWLSE